MVAAVTKQAYRAPAVVSVDPEQVAAEILAKSGLKPGANPAAIAKRLDVHVRYSKILGKHVLGWANPTERRISVAESIERREQAFTISHELMHIYDPTDLPAGRHIGGVLIERWCDRGAAALMMPAAEFIASGHRLEWDWHQLAKFWKHAPEQSIRRRIAEVMPGVVADLVEDRSRSGAA